MAIAHPGEVRSGWWVINELAKRVGVDLGILTSGMAFKQLVDAVPFYEGLTLEELGGRGVRWPEREQASAFPSIAGEIIEPPVHEIAPPPENAALRLGRYRPIWAAPEVEISPSLQYAIARQQVELSPLDAERLAIADGSTVDVAQNGTRLRAKAAVRSGVPEGTAFLAEGIASDSANAFTDDEIAVRKP
jgi:NADH-quinone oxidoreductase subunit G